MRLTLTTLKGVVVGILTTVSSWLCSSLFKTILFPSDQILAAQDLLAKSEHLQEVFPPVWSYIMYL